MELSFLDPIQLLPQTELDPTFYETDSTYRLDYGLTRYSTMNDPIDPDRILFAPTVLKQPYNNVELGIIELDLFGIQRSVTKKNTAVTNLLHPKQLAVIERDNELLTIAGPSRYARRPVIAAAEEQSVEVSRPVKKRAPRAAAAPKPTATPTSTAAPKPSGRGRGTKGKEPKKELKMVNLGRGKPGKK